MIRIRQFEGDFVEIESDEFMGILTISKKNVPELIERLQVLMECQ